MTFCLTMSIHLFSLQKPPGDEATAAVQSAVAEHDHGPASTPKHNLSATKSMAKHSATETNTTCK